MSIHIDCLCDIKKSGLSRPFSKVLSLGWYDGTTAGLAQCSLCSSYFKYDIVDWDREQERRIFAFSSIDAEKFDRIVNFLSLHEIPAWPFWSPRWFLQRPEDNERIMNEVKSLSLQASIPDYIVASDRRLDTIFGAKPVGPDVRDRFPLEFDGLPISDDYEFWNQYTS